MMPKPPKTTRRRGVQLPFYPGFRIWFEALKILKSLPRGERSKFINEAIVLLANQRKEETK